MVYNIEESKTNAKNADDDNDPPLDLAALREEMEAMKIRITTLEKGNRSDTVFLCGHVFKDDRDVSAWMVLHLPADKPFGSFVCIYSFLQRIVSPMTYESQKKLEVGGDEASNLEAL